MFWLGKYYLISFETDEANLKNLEKFLNGHPKRASTASPFPGGSQGCDIVLKCRPSELKQAEDIVEQSVDHTHRKSTYLVGYLTYEDRQKLNWSLVYPPSVYFITLGGSLAGDSGIKAWTEHMNVQAGMDTLASQFTPLFIKAVFVAIWPTIAALVAVAKNKVGT